MYKSFWYYSDGQSTEDIFCSMSCWLFWGVFRPILGYVPLFLKCYISFLTMFGTGVPSITKEVTTLKTFFAESPPLV